MRRQDDNMKKARDPWRRVREQDKENFDDLHNRGFQSWSFFDSWNHEIIKSEKQTNNVDHHIELDISRRYFSDFLISWFHDLFAFEDE